MKAGILLHRVANLNLCVGVHRDRRHGAGGAPGEPGPGPVQNTWRPRR